jgi:hypothetical protein
MAITVTEWNIIGISLMKTSAIDEVRDESHRNLSSLILGWRRPGIVKVEGDSLVYSARSVRTYFNPDEPFEILQGFLDLEGATSDKIARFARRWGVLGICEHKLPAIHNTGIHTFVDSLGWKLIQRYEYRDPCFPTQWSEELCCEPLDEWRFWIQQASIIVRLGAQLHALRPGDPKDWQFMGYEPSLFQGFIGGNKIPPMPPPIPLGRILLAQYINDWLAVTGVQPLFFWEQGKHAFYLSSWGIDRLLAILGVQILLLINRSSGYALCSNCGRPFLLRYRQSTARNVYCDSPGCGLKAAKRVAQKRYLLKERHNPSRDKRPKTRLTDKQVKVIRNKCNGYSGHQYPPGFIKELAENYGVSKSLIYKIAEGEARANVK